MMVQGVPCRTADFDYTLPPELIAQTPLEPRDSSRLLVLDRATGRIVHLRRFSDITEHLRPGDLLVFNDSRVIPARIFGHRADSGTAIELLLLHRMSEGVWRCLGRPGRSLRQGTRLVLEGNGASLECRVIAAEADGVRVVQVEDEAALEGVGTVPLPPYIKEHLRDPERYQTVYARTPGSAAAPTAGLHFTPELLTRMRDMGVEMVFVTLHVGAFTFRPVRVEDPREHALDAEQFELGQQAADAVNRARAEGRRVIGVGTTSVRVLESAALLSQAGGAGPDDAATPLRAISSWAELMVLPGHRFRVVDALLTNFHLPRSTLLMLVSALAGAGPSTGSGRELVLAAYREAVERRYRFYSFGDAMLVV
jgi:S-adenosylmethionine:tRNA ribosyltransferase-isomerase